MVDFSNQCHVSELRGGRWLHPTTVVTNQKSFKHNHLKHPVRSRPQPLKLHYPETLSLGGWSFWTYRKMWFSEATGVIWNPPWSNNNNSILNEKTLLFGRTCGIWGGLTHHPPKKVALRQNWQEKMQKKLEILQSTIQPTWNKCSSNWMHFHKKVSENYCKTLTGHICIQHQPHTNRRGGPFYLEAPT